MGYSVGRKRDLFEQNGRLQHVIFAQQFNRELIDQLSLTANQIRELAGGQESSSEVRSLLSNRRAMLFFTQASTRTFLSFAAACQLLGMQFTEVRDPSLSSEVKGESPLDSMRMFTSFNDIVIMRSGEPDFAEMCAWMMSDLASFNQRNVPIVNAGSGADEHPTQALLDMHTIKRSFDFEDETDSPDAVLRRFQAVYPDLARGVDGKTICFCGDIGRGRTVRSLALLLSNYDDITMHFIAPPVEKLQLPGELRSTLASAGVTVRESDNLEQVLPEVDLVYMTRVQHEHDSDDDARDYARVDWDAYKLDARKVSLMRTYAPVMHPFPRNDEISSDVDRDPRAMYFHQARNGMWMRAALLAYLFDADGRIGALHRKHFSDYHDYNRERQ